MTRYLAFWIVLMVVSVVVGSLTSDLGFRHVDLTFENVVQLLTVPACQALLLALATGTRARGSWTSPIRAAATDSLVAPLLVMDACVLGASWIALSHRLLGASGDVSILPIWTGTKAIAAAMFWLIAGAGPAPSSSGATPWRIAERVCLALFGIVVFAIGLDLFRPWIARVPAVVMPGRPRIVRWLIVYGGAYVMALVWTLVVGRTVRRRSRAAAAAVDAAAASAFVCALVVVPSVFLNPFLEPVPLALARTAVSLTMTCLLVSGILLQNSARVDA